MTKPENPRNFGIYVRNYPPETKQNDLIKYFSQFGNVASAHFGRDYLLLDFTENDSVNKVMTKNARFFNGKRLFIRHKLPTSNVRVPINDEKTNSILHQSIIEGLKKAPNFSEELKILMQKLQPNQQESCNKQTALCHDLLQILQKKFHRIQIFQFGSSMTGLGFHSTSDVDVYLSNVKLIDSNEEEEVRLLKIIKNMLIGSRKFGNTFVISTTKIPIVKCLHLATQLPCDINIKSMIGVWNSKLIYFYMNLDARVRMCMIVLKYWAKRHQLTKKSCSFTNYALVWLFVFFLQEFCNFPTVQLLQKHPYLVRIDNWTVEIRPFFQKNYTIDNCFDILKQFFEFYSNFDFKSNIIVPYLGQKFPREVFASEKTLPESCFDYRNYLASNLQPQLQLTGAIFLQDPIEHFRNLTATVTETYLEKFANLCKLGVKICSETNDNVLLKLLTKDLSIFKPEFSIKDDFIALKLPNTSLEIVADLLKVALCDILCFSMEKDEEFIFNCKSKVDMWSSRKSIAKEFQLNKEENLIQRELAVTGKLKELKKDLFETSQVFLELKLILMSYKEQLHEGVSISVQKLFSYKKSFKIFALFFTAKIPQWLQIYQKNTNNYCL